MSWQPTTLAEAQRMVWDEDDDGVDHCLSYIEPYLPDAGVVVDIGCGIGRLAVPLSERHPELEFCGVDTSESMLRLVPEARVAWLVALPDRFDFAYSVVTFQHISDAEVIDYLRAVAKADASIRFQFVEGTEREPLSMQRPAGWVREWCHASGFRKVDIEMDSRFENWRWVHAR